MLIMEDVLVNLQPSGSQKIILTAFCTQSGKASPGERSYFNLGNFVPRSMLKLVDIIEEAGVFDKNAQDAIWAYSEGNQLQVGEVTSDYRKELAKCIEDNPPSEIDRSLRYTLAGKKYVRAEDEPEPIPAREVTIIEVSNISGGAVFALDRSGTVDVGFYAPDGSLLKQVIQGQQRHRSILRVNFDLTMYDPPDGEYKLKFFVDGELDQEKTYLLKNGKVADWY